MNTDRDPSPILRRADYPFAVRTLASIASISAELEPKELAEAIRKTSPVKRKNLHRLALTILYGTSPKLAAVAEAFPPPTEQ